MLGTVRIRRTSIPLTDRRCPACGLKSVRVRECACCADLAVVCDPCGLMLTRIAAQ